MTNAAMEDPHSSGFGTGRNDGNDDDFRERYNECMKNSCCAHYCLGPNPSMARFIYALIFLVTCLLAWTVRDYGRNSLSELEKLKGCQGARYCLGAEGVLRISFGCFVSFV